MTVPARPIARSPYRPIVLLALSPYRRSGYAIRSQPSPTTLRADPLNDPRTTLETGLSGSYAVERELGRGGMATVYLAQDLKHGRPVALKVLRPALAMSMGPDRFRREITTAARLQHPHILSVHDSGETEGLLWYTMPYVRGESLKERLKRDGPLQLEEAIRITAEAGRALDYAHREGVIHRDVKPENILLTLDGDTLVADFGIARALSATNENRLTQAGLALGTPAYMAPEQATGERGVDARTDQYSLAIVCYEMVVGRPPFEGATAPAVIAKRFTTATPSARAARAEVPDQVDRALQRALALDPAERFGSVAEFVRALGAAAGSTPPSGVAAIPDSVMAPPPEPAALVPPKTRLILVVCVLAAVVIAAVLFAMAG